MTITSQDIEKTEFFQSLSPVLQKITLQKKNRDQIQHGVTVAQNIGLEQWEQITGTRYTNRKIVGELIESEKVEL